jgi:hypothetical protein
MAFKNRTTKEVFLDHLELAQQGDIETDLRRNFANDCELLTTYGVFKGHEGARAAAKLLEKQIGRTTYEYKTKMWHNEIAFLEWSAQSERGQIDDGADSFLIREGRIKIILFIIQ